MAVKNIHTLDRLDLSILAALVLFNPEVEPEPGLNYISVWVDNVCKNYSNEIYYNVKTDNFKGVILATRNLTLRLVDDKGKEQPILNIAQSLDYLTDMIYD